jgi:hypothetical protein
MGEDISFENAKSAFQRAVQIQQLALLDAEEANHFGNLSDISLSRESLSESVVHLERELSATLKFATTDDISIDEARRSEQ